MINISKYLNNKNDKKVLLLIEPGGIGDYVLLRPFADKPQLFG